MIERFNYNKGIEMKTITLKIIVDDAQGFNSENQVDLLEQRLVYVCEKGDTSTIFIKECFSLELVTEIIEDQFNKENVTIRESVSGGCYGARDGKIYKGLTLFLDSSLFDSRFIDCDFDEVVNIEQLCDEFGEKLEQGAEQFEEVMYAIGVSGKSDNTYNYLGHNSYDPVPLCHADFTIYELNGEDKPVVVSIKFHCGGDVRGNYSENVLYKFDDIYEVYNVLSPSLCLIDENNLDEIERLKDLIWKNPADKELLIQELEELIG